MAILAVFVWAAQGKGGPWPQVRPVFRGSWADPNNTLLSWDTTIDVTYFPMPVGVSVARVVLMRPCSVTHHSDMDQRYVELPWTEQQTGAGIMVQTPKHPSVGPATAPPGWYLMFLISTEDTPSLGKWVRLP